MKSSNDFLTHEGNAAPVKSPPAVDSSLRGRHVIASPRSPALT